jgi:hypothetical protein
MNVRDLLKSAGSKICYLEFEKRNGEMRRMWAIPKIKQSLLSGGPRAYDPAEYRITIVRDMFLSDEDCLRAVRWDAVTLISVCGETYTCDEEGKLHVTRQTRQKIGNTDIRNRKRKPR